MNRPDPLPIAARSAFSLLLRQARHPRNVSEIIDAVALSLPEDSSDPPTRAWLQNLEAEPARPLANVLWLDTLLAVLDLTWDEVLDAVNVDTSRRVSPEVGIKALRLWCERHGAMVIGGNARTGQVVVSLTRKES